MLSRPFNLLHILACATRLTSPQPIVQCEDQTYDIEAYLAVLKLYQFNPALKLDVETVR